MKRILREKTHHYRTLFSPESVDEFIHTHYAFAPILCGRSNAGKSTLINALFKNKVARTSKTPGKTREIQVFKTQISSREDSEFFIFDLPGYGHAKVSKVERARWDELMNHFFYSIQKPQLILHMLDANNPEQKNDLAFQKFIQKFDHYYCPIFNKVDKFKNQKAKNSFKEYLKEKNFEQSFSISALKKRNINLLEEEIINFYENSYKL